MRGEKRKIHFLPEFCKVISEPQWTYSCPFPQLHIQSFISLKISFIWAMSFPTTQLSALPQRLLACSDHSSLWVQPSGQLIPHSQDKTGWHIPTSAKPSAQSRTRQLWISRGTWHCPQTLCFVSVPSRELRLPSSCKLTSDLRSWLPSIQVPQSGLSPISTHSLLFSIQFCHLFTHQFHHLLHISSWAPCP